jgi:hypothetical protein
MSTAEAVPHQGGEKPRDRSITVSEAKPKREFEGGGGGGGRSSGGGGSW